MASSLFGSSTTGQKSSDEESHLLGSNVQPLTEGSAVTVSTSEGDSSSSSSSSSQKRTSSFFRRAQFRRQSKEKSERQTGFRTSVNVSRPPDHNRDWVYDDRSTHFRVLTQLYGSVWPRVLPFCFFSVIWTLTIYYLKKMDVVNLTMMSAVGHSFMGIMVSFLVVSRARITYARFMEARGHLSKMFLSCREVVQFSCLLTMHDREEAAKQWRQEVAYRTILMLRIAIAALEYRSSRVHTWELLPEHQDSLDLVCEENDSKSFRLSRWTHGKRSMVDENFRAPIILAYNVRETVVKQRNGKHLKDRMAVAEELRILNYVGTFIDAFHGLRKLISTPFPFPLVQMCRTFLFFWIFTLPMVLLTEMPEILNICIMMFIITYGFLGLEYVSMELDDPFGDDPNDFDDLGMAQIVFEDIYINICKVDGVRYAAQLRSKTSKNFEKGDALENFHKNIRQPSFWKMTASAVV